MITTHDNLDEVIDATKQQNQPGDKIHPWRICPIGKHFVKKHIMRIPPSKKHPDGETIERHEHCAINPSKKDIFSFDEIQSMTEKYFHQLSGPPKARVLPKYTYADAFDPEIRGWVRYWNNIFSSPHPLQEDLVKALIASESSFYAKTDIPSGQGKGRARGLMQVTDYTMHILSDHHGELSNHLICFEHPKLLDPSANICAGVRWLFRCMVIAESKLGSKTTWIDAVAQYKGKLNKKPPIKEMDVFLHHYACILKG
jgi:hypothetical protein